MAERERLGTYVGISVTDTHTDRDRIKEFRALGGTLPTSQRTRAAALGLWEGLSHSDLLHSIVIVLKVVAAKTNWRKKIWNRSLDLLVYWPTKSTSLKYY